MKRLFTIFFTLVFAIVCMTTTAAVSFGDESTLDYSQVPYDSLTAAELSGKTVILNTNDTHGAIEGFAKVAWLKDYYENLGAEVLLVDAGDFSQGASTVSMSKGLEAVKLMNKAGYDYVTFGNHEMDYGYEIARDNLSQAEFEVLCSNVTEKADGRTIGKNGQIYQTISGLKIGIIGLLTPTTSSSTFSDNVKALDFLTGESFFKAVENQVSELKAGGADLILVLSHMGLDEKDQPYRSMDLADRVKGIDIIADAHSHSTVVQQQGGTMIISTGTKFANIGITVIDKNGKITRQGLIPVTDSIGQDEELTVEVDRINAENDAIYGKVVAKTGMKLNGERSPGVRTEETNLGDLCADSFYYGAVCMGLDTSATAGTIAIVNGGGIRQSIEAGDITLKDINLVQPFENPIWCIDVTGKQLLEMLETLTADAPGANGNFPQMSGIVCTVDTSKSFDPLADPYPGTETHGPASINRVTIYSINGKPFDEKAVYTVVTNSYLAAGSGGCYNLLLGENRIDTGLLDREAFSMYVMDKLGGIIGSEYAYPQGRISVIGDQNSLFVDVTAGTPYLTAVSALCQSGVLKGTGNNRFEPDRPATCAELYTMLYRIYGKNTSVDATTGATPNEAYFETPYRWAHALGCLDETYSPTQSLTTENTSEIINVCRKAVLANTGAETGTNGDNITAGSSAATIGLADASRGQIALALYGLNQAA